ncbi:MAG: protein kinase, partial [Deltaproteobacteria bacterium]|nr:protein kinase [Deltaproteobacteria bacterium]
MNCDSCGQESPTGAKFCQECGTRFLRACASCGVELALTAKFCHECGQRMLDAPPPQPAGEASTSFGSGAGSARTAAAEPESIGGGRYRILRFAGEGAKKRVYLAHDERLERDVALAIIKAEGLDEAGRVRAGREAKAMARLGDHPNIVTVHDIGEENGLLFIVSQFMAGGDLEHALIQKAENRRVPLEDTLRIAIQLCSALGHAHSHGVVHRDMKPGNIWLAEDGTAKLGDFGLALSIDRTRLTQEGMMVGTAAYMAPEQALGRSADVRSDLYALGATIYEMLTGRPPFLGDDAVAIISQHINTRPVAPSWHRSDVPDWLEALVLELLEKDPTQRPESAASIRERLERGAALAAESGVAEVVDPNPLDRLASGVFVGREEQLATLHRGLEDALSGKGSVLLLVGEPGIGKTRTSEELTTYARMRGAQVLWGRCYEGEGAPSYWPWLQIVRAFVVERDPNELMSFMGPGAADIAEVVSEVRELLPGLPVPPALEPKQARFRLFDSITTFLRNASSGQPLVLVLDDLHWADKPSLLLLEFLARGLAASRILVLGTYRDVEISRQHPLEQTLAELARTRAAERVLLRGLTDDDVARFVELTSGRTPPAALVEAVYRETEGNPFFVHEVVRLLQSDGRLDDPDSVASWSVEIPQGVRQVIGRRLDALSAECNRVLTIGSAIGRDFEVRVLGRVADLEEDQVLELLEQAEDARVITEVAEAPGCYRFSHALVRETLYEEIRTTRRLRLHRRIA